MNLLEKFISLLQAQWDKPTILGWKHLMFIAITVLAVIIVCLTCKNMTDKQFRIAMLVIGICLILLEILKQLVFAYKQETNTWEYDWKQFPFQFCSTPMYVMVLVGLLKDCKFRDYLCSFLATFGLFAGLIVMCYPSTVLSTTIFRFCQSMVHHLTMVWAGVLVIVAKKVKLEHKTIFKGMTIFASLVIIAFCINIVFHLSGNTASFNMFYIGPFDSCDLPVFDDIGQTLKIDAEYIHIGNFLFLLLYIVAFTIATYLLLLLIMLASKIGSRGARERERERERE